MTKETLVRANELNNEIVCLKRYVNRLKNKTSLIYLHDIESKTDSCSVGLSGDKQIEKCLSYNKEIKDMIIKMYQTIIERDEKELEVL